MNAPITFDEQVCRQAYDDMYHKVRAEVGYDEWCRIWKMALQRTAPKCRTGEYAYCGNDFGCTGCAEHPPSGQSAADEIEGLRAQPAAQAQASGQAPTASAEPVLRIYAEGSMRSVTEWLDGARDLPDGDHTLYTAPVADQAPQDERMETTSEHIARDIREGRFPQRSEPQRVQATEWGPMPDAGVEADAHVAVIEGDEAVRVLRWNSDVGAFSYPVGTRLYAAQAPAADGDALRADPRTTAQEGSQHGD